MIPPEETEPIETPPVLDVRAALSSKYEIVENLGKGEVCTVYRAIHRKLNKEVALEILPPHLAQSDEYVDRFHGDVQAAAKLSHPNISRIYDEGVENGVHFIAVEFLDGTDLHTIIMWKGRLDAEETVKFVVPSAGALAYAHDKGIIHRDVRSSNIIVTDTGRSVLTDFWFDHAFRGGGRVTQSAGIGSLEYMSPEQAEGRELTRSSNIYCVGIVLYEALTGKVPFTGGNPFATVSKIINSPPVPPRQINPSIPTWMEDLILKCLAKNPSDRFSSAAELAGALLKSKYPIPVLGRQQTSERTAQPQPIVKEKTKQPAPKQKPPRTPPPEPPVEPPTNLPPTEEKIEKPVEVVIERSRPYFPIALILTVTVPIAVFAAVVLVMTTFSDIWNRQAVNSSQPASSEVRTKPLETVQPPVSQQTAPINSTPVQNEAPREESKTEPVPVSPQVVIQPPPVSNPVTNPSRQKSEPAATVPKATTVVTTAPATKPMQPERVARMTQVIDIQWVFVGGGTFEMGSNSYPSTKPVHSVKVPSFYITATEITFDQYDKFCEATGAKKPSDNGWGRGKMPVVNVSWNDAVAFCRWLSDQTGRTVHLPTEAQYEYAARGGDRSKGFQYSGTNQVDDAAWYSGNSGGRPHEAGTKAPNELGLFDMSGNIWEWCQDWYHQSYNNAPVDGSAWNEEDTYNPYHVVRGGSANGASYCSLVSFRFWLAPFYKDNVIGFRCVQEIK